MSDLKNKNILFLCSWFPTRVLPFNGNFCFKHARCMVRKGIPVSALTVCEDLSMSQRFEMVEGEEDGVEYAIIYYNYPIRLLKHLYKARGYFKGLKHLQKKKGAFDLIHVQILIDSGFIAWWLNIWKKIPYVLTENSTVFLPIDPNGIPSLLKPWVRRVIKRCSYMLPVSRDLEMNMKKLNDNPPFKIVPNVVDVELFQPNPKSAQKDKIKFLHISTFAAQKNMDGLLRVFKKLSEQRQDFSLTMAGDGDLEELNQKVAQHNFPENLILTGGKMNEKEVAAMYSSHDAFVLFSNHENLPCVLVEAQACGLPIITTDAGGSDEIVDSEEYGIVINIGDELALLESLNKMLDNFEKYDAQKIRRIAVNRYSDNAVAEAFIGVHQQVLNLS